MKNNLSVTLFSFAAVFYSFTAHAGGHSHMAITDQDYYPEASIEKITLGKFLFLIKSLAVTTILLVQLVITH